MLQTHWSTSSFGGDAGPLKPDLQDLGAHFARCARPGGRWGAVQCGAQALHGLVLGRLVTTVAVLALLASLGLLLA
jgi:hypothetical protein